MKFSEKWLRELVNPKVTTQELVDQLTMAGLEVDGVENVAGDFTGVVVGEILSTEQHPDADKLRVCQVAGGGDQLLQVVCGAPNARPGIKIPFALIGAELPPGDDGKKFKIKKAKLRGVESNGMLCAQTELQAGDDDAGLWELADDAPVGEDLRTYLGLDDNVIEVDLTPNRSDCFSLRGLAREVGVLNREDVKHVDTAPVKAVASDSFPVSLSAGEACSRYIGRVIRNVDISKPTPLWMQEKLRRSDVRSIDPVVDVTNYVLLELGQPMHAFDLEKLKGGINVRLASSGEKISLLDGQEIELNNDTLLITDESGPIAMAGIMGGSSTAVSEETKDIFLESAFFHPVAIAGKARSYGLHTDSSHRFERGVDYDLCKLAIERATELLIEIVGGTAGPVICEELADKLPEEKTVVLNKGKIESGLGFAIPDNDVVEILTRLGLTLQTSDKDSWSFKVPSYRFDIDIEQDLLEELARIYGYNNLPTTDMRIPALLPVKSEAETPVEVVTSMLVARGYQEAITYSFIDPKLHKLFDDGEGIALLNPISADMSVMRTSLLPGLVSTLQYNLNRQQQRVRLYEHGLKFVPGKKEGETEQTPMLAGLIYGSRYPVSWAEKGQDVDFFDLKGDLEAILAIGGKEVRFEAAQCKSLHPGQTANVYVDGVFAGYIGALHPQLAKSLDIVKPAYVFEVDLKAVIKSKIPSFAPLSKFPEVNRDLALVVDKQVSSAQLQAEIALGAGSYLKKLKVFDVYSGEGIDPQRKSVAFSLTFQHPSRTLKEEEISEAVQSVVTRLEDEFNASLR
ncbi:phenylalanine--tRNA ligase subunit beta [Teredinibacter sp. KSP-S5-2]|uniref:phenylalanine--tRNA ligase subunit beta n=1 Tax=Teredinibacter sp. KSP-S5-2 TaxID=3034506 RepID=UPI002934CD83|nr:phenylalanine--tRNA ligase subunit beta [Teredinibacter sp. KSP-S5-2]WNO07836.1 phenylalanine--tRNA ligase subunit beta [Teredinibacter sp. KSP-S5-2]